MKISILKRHLSVLAAMAGALLALPAAAQPSRSYPPRVREVPPRVIQEETIYEIRPAQAPAPALKREPEPQIIEIIPEDEARARAQRAKTKEKAQQPTIVKAEPGATKTGEVRPVEVPGASDNATSRVEPRRSAGDSTNPTARKKSQEPVAEERSAPEDRRTPPRRVSSSEREEAEDAQRQIEQLQKKVEKLQGQVAEARREGVTEPAPAPEPPTATVPPHTTPLPLSPGIADERKPLVIDTPPKVPTATTTVHTETSAEASRANQKPVEVAPLPQASEERKEAVTPHSKPGAIESIPTPSDVPVATKTGKPGFVKSPFPPNNLIDATGLPKGSLAKDPSTNKVFRVP